MTTITFFDLPAELRNRIYELTILPQVPAHLYEFIIVQTRRAPPLCRASKQFRAETLSTWQSFYQRLRAILEANVGNMEWVVSCIAYVLGEL